MNKLLGALCVFAIVLAPVTARADIYSEMNMKPLTPETTAAMKAQVQAAKAKWASMTPAEKSAVTQSMRGKKLGELSAMERVAQNDDMTAMTRSETAQQKAERETAQASYAKMTPEQKAAMRKAAQRKKLADLSMLEKVGQNDDMGREF